MDNSLPVPTEVVLPTDSDRAMRALTDVSEFISPAVPSVLKYWIEKSSGRAGPSRAEIDALDMPPYALPHLMIVAVEPDPFRVKYRLVGTHTASMYGLDYTGRYLDELILPKGLNEIYHQSYAFVLETKQPIVGHATFPRRPEIGGGALTEFAILPLIEHDAVTHFLAIDHLSPDRTSFAGELVPLRLASR